MTAKTTLETSWEDVELHSKRVEKIEELNSKRVEKIEELHSKRVRLLGVGEPSTQMTLNTFHLAGHGGANVTLGKNTLETSVSFPSSPLVSSVFSQVSPGCVRLCSPRPRP